MYKLCKLYESVFERHTISCIVYLALSFLMILLLLLMPHGIVRAASSGSSASTSVIQGGGSNDDDINGLMQLLGETDSGSKCYFLHDSVASLKNSDVSYINLSDIFTINGNLRGDDSYFSVDTINSYLENIPLIYANEFYTYSGYNYRILEADDETIIFTISNCEDQIYYSNDVGLEHVDPNEGGTERTGLIDFSKGNFINETIVYNVPSASADYYIGYNLDISDYFAFYGTWDDWEVFDGPFYWNSSMILSKYWNPKQPIATNYIYVEDGNPPQLFTFDDVIDSHNGFLSPGEESDDDDLGDDSNHLYLDGANWNFNNVPRKFLSNNGNIYFQCVGLDEYQENHLNNFYLNYDFKIECSVNYNTFLGFHSGGGGGHSFGTSANNYKFSEGLFQYYKDMGNYYSSFLPTQTSIRIPHKDTFVFYYKNPQDNTSFYRQTLEQFYNSGDKATFFTKNYLYDNCFGLARIDDDGSQYNCSFSNFIYSLDTLYDEWALENVTITCNAQIFDIEGGQGGSCRSSYNFVNGTENRIDTGMSINPNPYYGTGVDVATGSNANSNSSVINSGNINIENNPSIVINNDNSGGKGSGDTNFIIQLVHGIFGVGSNENLDSIEPGNNGFFEWMGVNNWLSVINSAFSFIPVGFFQTLYLYFSVCIFILICAFVLKIIVEFL